MLRILNRRFQDMSYDKEFPSVDSVASVFRFDDKTVYCFGGRVCPRRAQNPVVLVFRRIGVV